MSWERRGGTSQYYTRSRRVGGRIEREYLGYGATAQLIALLDADARLDREAAAEEWREDQARDAALDQLIVAVVQSTDHLATAALRAAGFYRHYRTWRRRGDHENHQRISPE